MTKFNAREIEVVKALDILGWKYLTIDPTDGDVQAFNVMPFFEDRYKLWTCHYNERAIRIDDLLGTNEDERFALFQLMDYEKPLLIKDIIASASEGDK